MQNIKGEGEEEEEHTGVGEHNEQTTCSAVMWLRSESKVSNDS